MSFRGLREYGVAQAGEWTELEGTFPNCHELLSEVSEIILVPHSLISEIFVTCSKTGNCKLERQ